MHLLFVKLSLGAFFFDLIGHTAAHKYWIVEGGGRRGGKGGGGGWEGVENK